MSAGGGLGRAKRLAVDLAAAAAPGAALRARARRAGATTALCYHTLGPDAGGTDAWTALRVSDFARQAAFLRARYDVVSLDDALEAAAAAARRGPRTGRPLAVVTFDDGDAGLRRHLPELLSRAPMPVTIYVATGQIESGRPFWFDRVMNALQAPGPVEIDLRDAGLRRWTLGPARPGGADAARWGVVSDILETLKTVDPARRETLADAIAARAPRPDRPPPPLAPMTPEEVAELARCEGVTIGAHSHGHELLDQVPEARARASIARSRALLEAWTGRPVRHFAYPNGNLSPAVARAVAQAGFVTGAALGPVGGEALWTPRADPFALPRIAIGRYDRFARFRLRLAGI